MNQADILKLCEEALFKPWNGGAEVFIAPNGAIVHLKDLTRFAELVAQHERETGAKKLDEAAEFRAMFDDEKDTVKMLNTISSNIRRGFK